MEEVNLKKFRRIAYTQISDELAELFAELARVDVSTQERFMYDAITVRVVQHIWGEELDKIEVRYPADWWEAFKERWFPGWARKRWPVKWKAYRLTARGMYPKLSLPDKEHRIYLDKSRLWE